MHRFILLLLCLFPSLAMADANIFACEPEWAALAQEIGGEKITVTAATRAQEDPHHLRPKPSLLAAMRKADLVICSGASLEIGWLPVLLQKAGSAGVQPGATGNLVASDYVQRLEVPTKLDRAEGDIHPEGNPHIHLNPHNVARVAAEMARRLAALDVANAAYYEARQVDFLQRWEAAVKKWEAQAASLRGTRVVVHHKSLTYLLNWLGMEEAGTLEAKPGIPPTPSHLKALLQKLRTNPAKLILRTPYEPERASLWLSEQTGTRALVLPYTVGGDEQSGDLFGLFERTLGLLGE